MPNFFESKTKHYHTANQLVGINWLDMSHDNNKDDQVNDTAEKRRSSLLQAVYKHIVQFSQDLAELVTIYAFVLSHEFLPLSPWKSAWGRFPLGTTGPLLSVRYSSKRVWNEIRRNWCIGIAWTQWPHYVFRIVDDGRLLSPDNEYGVRTLPDWPHFMSCSSHLWVHLWFDLAERSIVYTFQQLSGDSYKVKVWTGATAQEFAMAKPYLELWGPGCDETSVEVVERADNDDKPHNPLICTCCFKRANHQIYLSITPKTKPSSMAPTAAVAAPPQSEAATNHRIYPSTLHLRIKELCPQKDIIWEHDFEYSDTIQTVRQWIATEKQQNPDAVGRLVFAGKQLESDDLTLADYNIPNGATIHLVSCLRGS